MAKWMKSLWKVLKERKRSPRSAAAWAGLSTVSAHLDAKLQAPAEDAHVRERSCFTLDGPT